MRLKGRALAGHRRRATYQSRPAHSTNFAFAPRSHRVQALLGIKSQTVGQRISTLGRTVHDVQNDSTICRRLPESNDFIH